MCLSNCGQVLSFFMVCWAIELKTHRERTWDSCYADKIKNTPISVFDVSLRWTVRDRILSEKLIHFLIKIFSVCSAFSKRERLEELSLFRCVKRSARCTMFVCAVRRSYGCRRRQYIDSSKKWMQYTQANNIVALHYATNVCMDVEVRSTRYYCILTANSVSVRTRTHAHMYCWIFDCVVCYVLFRPFHQEFVVQLPASPSSNYMCYIFFVIIRECRTLWSRAFVQKKQRKNNTGQKKNRKQQQQQHSNTVNDSPIKSIFTNDSLFHLFSFVS